jgi:type IV secretory pathway VirB2 component (pilin)
MKTVVLCNIVPLVRKFRQSDLALVALALLVVASCSLPGFAQSYGSEITNATVSLYTWLRGLGAGVTVLGIAGAGFKIVVQHDREGMKSFLMVIGGGLIIMLAPSMVAVIQGTAGAAATITTN